MYVGSGDTAALLAGKDSKAHQRLLQRFVSNTTPYRNAKASPIDALRTGAILEDRYIFTLPEGYYPQCVVYCKEIDVLRATLDFALFDNGVVVDFDELKTCFHIDYLDLVRFRDAGYESYISFIKSSYTSYYNQVQQQLFCTGLEEANLVFLAVYSYNDEVNYARDVQPSEYIKFRIRRDEKVIDNIYNRATPFQLLKTYYK